MLRSARNAAPRRGIRPAVAAAVVGLMASCSATAAQHGSSPATPPPRDPHTVTALLKIATVFNNDYDNGVYGPVYDRWDARSRAIISRAEYIRRHAECPTAPISAHVEGAHRGPRGAWLVSYVISGAEAQLTDYWFYVDGRWEFDLPLSNPSSVHLYRLSGPQYLAALGCSH